MIAGASGLNYKLVDVVLPVGGRLSNSHPGYDAKRDSSSQCGIMSLICLRKTHAVHVHEMDHLLSVIRKRALNGEWRQSLHRTPAPEACVVVCLSRLSNP